MTHTKPQRQKAMKLAAEKYFERWHTRSDLAYVPHSLYVPNAFIAGAKWAMRKKKGKKK